MSKFDHAWKTLDVITANPAAWEQATWRCETGMCFAGTYADLKREWDWVVPQDAMAAAAGNLLGRLSWSVAEAVEDLASYIWGSDSATERLKDVADWYDWTGRDKDLLAAALDIERKGLGKRRVVHVSEAVRKDLGITAYESNLLFAPENSLSDIRRHLERVSA